MLRALHKGLDSTPKIPIHIACFSEDGDSLSQSRGYCPGDSGFGIGFSADQLLTSLDADPDTRFVKQASGSA